MKLSDLVPNNNKMSYNLISKEAMKFIEDSHKKIVEKDRREEANRKIEKEALKEWTILLPNVMELEAFLLCVFSKASSGPPWD